MKTFLLSLYLFDTLCASVVKFGDAEDVFLIFRDFLTQRRAEGKHGGGQLFFRF
jgi:hypothetical protein